MSLAAGTRLGPYEIVAPLGAGGMGEVYRARDSRLGRDVALKILPASVSKHPDSRARFEREARTVSGLNHPNICVLHDVGREDDTDYLVLKLVDGESLATRLQRGALPAADALRTGVQIADALDRAHRAGVIHRDLKPGNIMLAKSGAKLMDFGLARAPGLAGPGSTSGVLAAGLSQSPTIAAPLTAEGTLIGTFQYMSPEQLEGKEADTRSDIWALGCVLYEMLTGRRAFEGKSQASLIAAIMNTEPTTLSQIAPLVPAGLDRVVRQCLAKDPDERWQSAGDLGRELGWLGQSGSLADATAIAGMGRPTTHRRRIGLELAAIVVGSIATVLATRLLDRKPSPPPLRFEIQAPPGQAIDPNPPSSAIAPDGRSLAFLATDSSGTSRIWLRSFAALAAKAVTGTENAQMPFWSPDSKWLAFFADGKLEKIAITGGTPEMVCDAPDPRGGTWGRRGVIVFSPSGSGGLARVPAEGGTPAVAVAADTAHGETSLRWPEFLPDGEQFLFVSVPPGPSGYHIGLAGLDGRVRRDVFTSNAAPVPAGRRRVAFARSDRLLVQAFDARAGKLTGEAVTLGDAPPPSGHAGARAVSMSRNGVMAHPPLGLPNTELSWLDRTGRVVGTVPAPLGRYETMAMSPDGSRILASRRSSASHYELWMLDSRRPVATRFSPLVSTFAHYMAWSPDGEWIAYGANPRGPGDLYRQRADGGGEELLLQGSAPFQNLTSWLPHGEGLLFARPDPKSGWDLMRVLVDGDRKPVPVLAGPDNVTWGTISPDGRWLAYVSDEAGRNELYVVTFPALAGKYQVSTGGTFAAAWSADGRRLLFPGLDGTLLEATVIPGARFSIERPRTLFRMPSDLVWIATNRNFDRFLMTAAVGTDSRPTLTVEFNWASDLERK